MGDLLDLSIVVPVHNSSLTLDRALDSIAHASAMNPRISVEAIVVFDGPDPDSEEILASREGEPSAPIRALRKSHGGVSSARNLGINNSRAELITFLDADDEITESRLDLAELRASHFLVGRQHVIFDTVSTAPAGISPNGEQQNHYFNSMVVPRHVLLELGGFDESLALGQDLELAIRARDLGYTVDLVDAVTTIRHVTGRNASLDVKGAQRELFLALAKNKNRTALN